MANEIDDAPLPFVLRFDMGTLPGNDVCLRLEYVTSAEQFEARQSESMAFAIDPNVARQLGRALIDASMAGHPER
jgi:hypothetical protein